MAWIAMTCPQCGATYPTDETCEERFNVSQVTELEQPGYYAVTLQDTAPERIAPAVASRRGRFFSEV